MPRHFTRLKGIALIMVLICTIFLVMFASAVIFYSTQQQRSTSLLYQHTVAGKAAETGINYVMSRLENNPHWMGFETPDEDTYFSQTVNGETVFEVYEHPVSPDGGCVEGKVVMGTTTAYFDLYFQKPKNDNRMKFFKWGGPAGPMPGKVILCDNRQSEDTPAPVMYSNSKEVPYKKAPGRAVFVVCRGKVGNESKTIETCLRVGPPNDSCSVAIGRGNVNLVLSGAGDDGDGIRLIQGPASNNKPSILRAVGSMNIAVEQPASFPGNEYLEAQGSCGGRSGDGDPLFHPDGVRPPNAGCFFNQQNMERYLQKLTLCDVMPDSEEMDKIRGMMLPGMYFIRASKVTDKYPRVIYIPRDNPDNIEDYGSLDPDTGLPEYENSGFNVSLLFREMIDAGYLDWDGRTQKLTILKSTRVLYHPLMKNLVLVSGGYQQVPYEDEFGNIRYTTASKERLTVQIGQTPEEDKKEPPPVYLINSNDNGGGIYVDGQLSGTGTVICEGNLAMEAQSQMEPNSITGISIYTGGSVEVNPINAPPLLDTSQVTDPGLAEKINRYNNGVSIFRKILRYIYEEKKENQSTDTRIPVEDILNADEMALLESSGLVWLDNDQKTLTVKVSKDKSDIDMRDLGDKRKEKKINLFIDGVKDISKAPADFESLQTMFASPEALKRILNEDAVPKTGSPELYDTIFRGLVYACNSFKADQGNNRFILEGGLVAFGGTMDGRSAMGDRTINGETIEGNIDIKAKDFDFIYNSRYLSMLTKSGEIGVDILYWTSLK